MVILFYQDLKIIKKKLKYGNKKNIYAFFPIIEKKMLPRFFKNHHFLKNGKEQNHFFFTFWKRSDFVQKPSKTLKKGGDPGILVKKNFDPCTQGSDFSKTPIWP